MSEDYIIYIGGKPFMNYVTAVVMQFTTKGASTVIIRSRGKFISRAIDVAEVVRSRFLKDQVQIDDMEIGSEEFKNKEGREIRVSTLDITMSRVVEKAKKTAPKAPKKAEKKEAEKKEEKPAEEKPAEPVTETSATEEAPKPETAE